MEIFRTGNRLVMMVRMADGHDASREEAVADAKTLEWEALMDRYQQRLPWAEAGQKWVPMRRIFSLADS
jgi:L-rhamnose mutarotase